MDEVKVVIIKLSLRSAPASITVDNLGTVLSIFGPIRLQ